MKAILRKIIIALIAGAIVAVSAGVLVVSAAFACYGALKEMVGAPGASALTALAAALLMLGVAFGFEAWAQGSKKAKPHPAAGGDQDLLQKIIGMAQERPIVSVGALIGGIALAIRNPALVAIVVKAFLDPKSKPPRKG